MHPQYQKAIKLRLAGKSYGEIAKTLDVSKGSFSLWFKNLKLPKSAQKLLEEKMRIAREHGLFENNRRRTQAIKIENKKVRQIAANEVKPLSKYELLLIGAALYWAEGYNRQDKVPSPYISFGNSNPDMVVLFLRFLREVMQISEKKLRPIVQIHKNIKPESAINFWAKITSIPQKSFRVTHQASRASKGKRPYNSLPYGTFKLNVIGRQNFFKIKGWIDGLVRQT
ncbi:hypothetical protein COT20_00110 [bacterium (Candidatus Gribaldobacteria) CG08_land_8_20_14_0_20_39_15]|uniref:Uncharacterized protein n=1 Tax=bacterium (Candidatus Gribaldobacteria) CG08_land_8_20_14_0_20_39_15 TaxID=2014273 RepID=A0A2M6XVC3_9BACT|nr:MAG: hypothetical protein COT20_00110 [bacterium (Candidatus Gribaldobacteria) CG08_land_8_20_14_0_20_39_15]